MKYVNLGNTGLKVSRICLGTMTYGTSQWRSWVLDEDAARPFFVRALEGGINFFDTADARHRTRFVSMQNHYNLIYREEEREMIPLCISEGAAVIPWSPLARGFLAGNRTRGKTDTTERSRTDDYAHQMYYSDADFDVVDRVIEIAKKRGVAPAQIALAWLLHKPGVTAPIVGASKLHQLDDAIAAIDIALDDEEIGALEAPYVPHRVLGHK